MTRAIKGESKIYLQTVIGDFLHKLINFPSLHNLQYLTELYECSKFIAIYVKYSLFDFSARAFHPNKSDESRPFC